MPRLAFEFRTIGDEQSALRRLATLVTKGASPAALFEAVAEEACLLLRAMPPPSRYDPNGRMTTAPGAGPRPPARGAGTGPADGT